VAEQVQKPLQNPIIQDGRGTATDNAVVELLFRTIKWKHIYLNRATIGLNLSQGINEFIEKYNHRKHQGINRKEHVESYKTAA
jgi:putative transposase